MSETISNTSPIQYLHQLGLLHLLPTLFTQIIIPEAVMAEIAEGQRRGVPLPSLGRLDWIAVQGPSAPAVLPMVHDLGPGEREALALAIERPGSRVLLDDRYARLVATTLGIPVIGTLGILLRAKRAGHLNEVRPLLDRLDALGFRVDRRTRLAVLSLADETS